MDIEKIERIERIVNWGRVIILALFLTWAFVALGKG